MFNLDRLLRGVTVQAGYWAALTGCLAVLLVAGCAGGRKQQPTVSAAVESAPPPTPTPAVVDAPEVQPADSASDMPTEPAPRAGDVIATINGRPITRGELERLIYPMPAFDALEQLMANELVLAEARRRGVQISESDVQAEYDAGLEVLAQPYGAGKLSRDEKERVLDEVLARKRIGRDEYMLVMRRRAYLRKLASRELVISEPELRQEFDRLSGAQFQLRQIVVATAEKAEQLRQELANGADFAQLAERQSEDRASAARGGLREPFSMFDQTVPEPIRQAAAELHRQSATSAGTVSNPLRVNERYVIVKLEQVIPPSGLRFEDQRATIEARLKAARLPAAMDSILRRELLKAEIQISHPQLRQYFDSVKEHRMKQQQSDNP